MKRFLVVLLVLALSVPFVVAACGEEEESPSPSPSPTMATMDIVETAQAAGNFTTLVTALEAAGLDETLMGEGPFTVFFYPLVIHGYSIRFQPVHYNGDAPSAEGW